MSKMKPSVMASAASAFETNVPCGLLQGPNDEAVSHAVLFRWNAAIAATAAWYDPVPRIVPGLSLLLWYGTSFPGGLDASLRIVDADRNDEGEPSWRVAMRPVKGAELDAPSDAISQAVSPCERGVKLTKMISF